MRLLDELRSEHVLIERVAGSLLTFAAKRARGEAAEPDGEAFLRFFTGYSGGYHHAREEDTLFPALVASVGLPADSGPIAAFLGQHREMEGVLSEMTPLLLATAPIAPGDAARLPEMAGRYVRELWQHIDAENSVLFPESEERLRRAGVAELPSRPARADEDTARAEGERLVAAYPPSVDPGAVRGEGCVVCPSYGTTCGGVEREWWNDYEWDEFSDRLG